MFFCIRKGCFSYLAKFVFSFIDASFFSQPFIFSSCFILHHQFLLLFYLFIYSFFCSSPSLLFIHFFVLFLLSYFYYGMSFHTFLGRLATFCGRFMIFSCSVHLCRIFLTAKSFIEKTKWKKTLV